MSNKKPVLTIIIRDHKDFSAEEFCTAVATAVVWFVDEVNAGYSHSKHEVALRNWELTGRRLSIRLATDDQWWSFLMADGMTDRIGDMYFHVFPPTPKTLLPDFVRYCPEREFKPSDEFDIEPRETDIKLPLFSIILKRNHKVGLTDYALKAADVALAYLDTAMKRETAYQEWSKNNFALNVGIVDELSPIEPPELILEERGAKSVDAMGLWVQ
jgi:hypothetical protein